MDMFAREANPLAFVRFYRSKGADAGGRLTQEFLVDPFEPNHRLSFHGGLDGIGHRKLDWDRNSLS